MKSTIRVQILYVSHKFPRETHDSICSPHRKEQIVWQTGFFNLGKATSLGERKH